MDLFSESKWPVVYIYFKVCNLAGFTGGFWIQASVFSMATTRRKRVNLVPVGIESLKFGKPCKISLLHRGVFSDYDIFVYDKN
jgi:hypothetical protein